MTDRRVTLRGDAAIELAAGGRDGVPVHDVDCRLLFMGTNYVRLLGAYPEVVRLLESAANRDEALARIAESPDVSALYEADATEEGLRVRVRDELFSSAGPVDALSLELRVSAGGRTAAVALTDGVLAAVGDVLALLTGARHERDALAEIDALPGARADAARVVWGLLAGVGAIEEAGDAAPDPLDGGRAPSVRFLGHTSLLFRSPQTTLVTDPIFLAGRSAVTARSLVRLRPDVVLLSHSHWDHCHLQTLALLDRRATVVIPRVQTPTAFNPPMRPALESLGFGDVREAELWTPVRVGDVEVVPVPFFGEQDEPGAEIDHYTYVLRTEGLCVYGGVDAYRDTFGEMEPVLDEVRERWSPDVAFLPVSKMTYDYRTGGVNGYCRTIEPRLLGERFQYTAAPEDAARWAVRLGVRWAVPYAAFCIGRWEALPGFGDVARAFDEAGARRTLLPLRPLDAISARELGGGAGLAARRAFATAYYGSPAATAAAPLLRRMRARLARALRD